MAGKVGYDMYMKMLKAAVKKIRGLALPSVGRTRMHVEGLGSGDDFDLPEGYAPDVDRDREVAEARLACSAQAHNGRSAPSSTRGSGGPRR